MAYTTLCDCMYARRSCVCMSFRWLTSTRIMTLGLWPVVSYPCLDTLHHVCTSHVCMYIQRILVCVYVCAKYRVTQTTVCHHFGHLRCASACHMVSSSIHLFKLCQLVANTFFHILYHRFISERTQACQRCPQIRFWTTKMYLLKKTWTIGRKIDCVSISARM